MWRELKLAQDSEGLHIITPLGEDETNPKP